MRKLNLSQLANGLQRGMQDTKTFEFFKDFKGFSQLEGVKDFSHVLSNYRPIPCNDNKPLNITVEQALEIVKNFYYSIGLKEEVDKIFADSQTYKLNISSKEKDSYVNHSGNNTYLDIVVGFDGDLIGLRNIAHEFAHAMSNHHLQRLSLIKSGNSVDGYNSTLSSFNHDCVGEIESHIIELLFNDYLCNQGLICSQDIENFNTGKLTSLFNNFKLIYEEKDISQSLQPPITEIKLQLYLAKCKLKGKLHTQLDRIKFIENRLNIDPNAYPKKRFRYIIGEIVSNGFYETYINSTEAQQKELLKTLKNYLTKTDILTVEEATQMLTGKNLSDSFEDYATILDEKIATI